MLKQEAYYWIGGHRDTYKHVFDRPEDVYLGEIEKAWGDYIKHQAGSPMINRVQWVCLLPPGYSQLRVEPHCNGLHLFLRHSDDESAKEWEHTIDYASTMLDRAQDPNSGFIFRTLGRPVIIVFGTRIKLFYFVHHRKEAPFPVTVTSPHRELAARYVEAEPVRRLVQLLRIVQSILENQVTKRH